MDNEEFNIDGKSSQNFFNMAFVNVFLTFEIHSFVPVSMFLTFTIIKLSQFHVLELF
jgi:hypothetical protein